MNAAIPNFSRPVSRVFSSLVCHRCARNLSRTASIQSGHNKWSTIKHDKARQDASRSRQRGALGKDISEASKNWGPDPALNPRLADAIATAKRAGMPKANIETAIARGQGRSSSGAALEHVMIEAVVPPVALIVDCQTESKARTLQELRLLLKDRGGTATPTSYLFEKRGRCTFRAKEDIGADEVFDVALEAGALDVIVDDEGRVVVDTEPSGLKEAESKISEAFGLDVASSETVWHPKTETKVDKSSLDEEPLMQLEKLQEELQKLPEVQGVYMNLDLEGAINEASRVEAVR